VHKTIQHLANLPSFKACGQVQIYMEFLWFTSRAKTKKLKIRSYSVDMVTSIWQNNKFTHYYTKTVEMLMHTRSHLNWQAQEPVVFFSPCPAVSVPNETA
jgi:hypothetical protein